MSEGRLVSKRRKEIAAWAVENFKTWPAPHEEPDADPGEIGCELVVLEPHTLPVLRCKFGGGFVCSTTWWYAKRVKSEMDDIKAQIERIETLLAAAADERTTGVTSK